MVQDHGLARVGTMQVQAIIPSESLTPFLRETLCESGRCIDALKKRRRALKKRGRFLRRGGGFLRRGV